MHMMECGAQLTTQEAADLLGIGCSTLLKLLEDGCIPFTMVGRHRRIMLADLRKYAERRHQEHIAMFDELAAEENPVLTLDNPLIRR